jgi:hypothetical protein
VTSSGAISADTVDLIVRLRKELELLRELTLDPTRDYQPTRPTTRPQTTNTLTQRGFRVFSMTCEITLVAGVGFEPT